MIKYRFQLKMKFASSPVLCLRSSVLCLIFLFIFLHLPFVLVFCLFDIFVSANDFKCPIPD